VSVSGADAIAIYNASPYFSLAPSPAYPSGRPDDDWTLEQLRAYASDEGISLSGQRTKLQVLALLDPAHTVQPF
jgi:hypothetical protein